MSVLMEMHAAHKARQERLGGFAPRAPAPQRITIPIRVEAEDLRQQVTSLCEQVIDLGGTPGVPVSGRPTVRRICVITARRCGVDLDDIFSERRTKAPTRARQISMYLAKTLTLQSLPEIGRWIGDRDHTTVLHAVRKITALRAADADLDALLNLITQDITGGR